MQNNMPSTIDIINEQASTKFIIGEAPFVVDANAINEKFQLYYNMYDNRTVSIQELKYLNALCNTFKAFDEIKNNENFHFAFGNGATYVHSIFKTPDNLWIIWLIDGIRYAFVEGIYNNCYDACLGAIKCLSQYKFKNWTLIEKEVSKQFENEVNSDTNNDILIKFATKMNYTISNVKKKVKRKR